MKQYLDLIRNILENGHLTPQRAVVHGAPVNQLVLPGLQFRHNMDNGFPLLTTKAVSMHNIAVELEWFLSGRTDKEFLQKYGVHIWDDWGLPRDSSKLGRVYGFQWRHYSKYIEVGQGLLRNSDGTYETTGEPAFIRTEVDQVQELIDGIKKDPFSRRFRVTAWNPAEIDQMALPTCHTEWQPVVTGLHKHSGKRIINLHMNQRSADMMLGVPYNIASYALLLLLLAKEFDFHPGELICSFVNAHIYENHIDAAMEQVLRVPRILPEVKLDDYTDLRDEGSYFDMLEWTHKNMTLMGYHPMGRLKMDVAV